MLAMALATDNTRSFSILDQNEIQFLSNVSQRANSEAATVTDDERLAWVASQVQETLFSSFVWKVKGANYKKANKVRPLAHKFASCSYRK